MESSLSDKAKFILHRQLHGLPEDDGQGAREATILKYATTSDRIILIISTLCAVAAGILNPFIAVVFGGLAGVFNEYVTGTVQARDFRSRVSTYSLYYVYLAIAMFVLIYVSTVGFYYAGERIIRATRNAYIKAILRQNMAYFDDHDPGNISTRIMSDMNAIQEGITSKVSIAVTAAATFTAAFVIVFVMSWRTALVLSPTFVIMVAIFTLGSAYVVRRHKQANVANSQASGLAEETIASMRHVFAFGMQEHFGRKYESFLEVAGAPDIRFRGAIAVMIAWSNAVPSLVYALAFWAGSIFLVKGWINVAQLTTTAMAVTIGAFAIVRVGPAAQALTSTISRSGVVLEDIARRSPQDPFAADGESLDTVEGQIELKGVSLIYPTRDDRLVLDDVSFTCPAMKTTAIVGASGCGKSSIISLLERFYEPTGGHISLDGKDIQSLNLRWFRGQMALVGQSPSLFDTTIFENIRYGQVASEAIETSDREESVKKRVYSAAKKANAHDFIMSLPDGYETRVGSKGFQLSGGQRQRIALARALIRDPAVLLLDEATSALDSKSEAAVQHALESAALHRTTIVVAHRLSTIRNADKIIVMSNGRVIETGNHDRLVALDGHYASLVYAQQTTDTNAAIVPDAKVEDQAHGTPDISISDEVAHGSSDTPHAAVSAHSEASTANADGLSLAGTLAFIIKFSKADYAVLLFGLFCSIIAGLGIPGRVNLETL